VVGALAIGACSDDDGGADGSGPTASGPATGATGTAVPGCQPAPGYTVTPGSDPAPPSPYNGLGTWIDVFDFAPGYSDGAIPVIGPEQIPAMAALGIKTIYIQAARNDETGLNGVTEPELMGRFLQAAHARGMCVVAWFLPRFADVEADWARLQAILAFEPTAGERFDGVGVDIEFRGDEADPAVRSERLVQLSERLRQAAPGLPLGAIVPPPVLMEVVNPNFWPDFPWKRIAPFYDVWMPMTYWTFRNSDDPYRDAFTYTDESIRRMRANLDMPDAPVHPIGGVADTSSHVDDQKFVQAATTNLSIGLSLYDYRTTATFAWTILAPKGQGPG
jgi:hypothetical protein